MVIGILSTLCHCVHWHCSEETVVVLYVFVLCLRSRQLRNVQQLQAAAMAILDLYHNAPAEENTILPHASTISRAKPKIDVAMMLMRRMFWDGKFKGRSIQLGTMTG